MATETEKLRERVSQEMEENPIWNQVVENHWLCPYCGDAASGRAEEGEVVDDIVSHLVEVCPSWNRFEGTYLTMRDLQVQSVEVAISRNLSTNSLWKLFDGEGRWYCPYCGLPVEIDGSVQSDPVRLRALFVDHISGCTLAKSGRGRPLPPDHLKRQVQLSNIVSRLTGQVRVRMERDVGWTGMGESGSWLCPFCHEGIDTVDVSSEFVRRETAPLRAANHLVRACEAYRKLPLGTNPEGKPSPSVLKDAPGSAGMSLEEMESVIEDAIPVDSDISVTTPSAEIYESVEEGAAESDDLADLDDLASSEEIEPEKATISQKIERARTGVISRARVRLLSQCPEAPVIKGIDVARLYRPSKNVNGDGLFLHVPGEKQLYFAVYTLSPVGVNVVPLNDTLQERLLESTRQGGMPKEILVRLNQGIEELLEEREYISILCGYLNRTAGKLWLANAGHVSPLIYRPFAEKQIEMIRSNGFVLCRENQKAFAVHLREVVIPFERQDLFIGHGDRSIQVTDHMEREFGAARLEGVLNQHGQEDATYLLEVLQVLLSEHTGSTDFDEDVTFLAVKSY